MSTTPEETPAHLMVVDLTAAAAMLVALMNVPGRWLPALYVWEALTGLEGDAARAYAQALAADPDTTVTATVAPF